MSQHHSVIVALLHIFQLIVICQSNSDEVCWARPTGMHMSLTTQRNQVGAWLTKVGLLRGGGRSLADTTATDQWTLDVESNTVACEGTWSALNVTITITAPLPKARPDYELFPGVGFYKFHSSVNTWPLARKICADEGAHLVIINSEKEAEVMKTLFSRFPAIAGATSNDYAWIGIERKNGNYLTLFGDNFDSTGYNKWGSGNPKKGANQDCILVHRVMVNIHDITCDWKVAFICEHEL